MGHFLESQDERAARMTRMEYFEGYQDAVRIIGTLWSDAELEGNRDGERILHHVYKYLDLQG